MVAFLNILNETTSLINNVFSLIQRAADYRDEVVKSCQAYLEGAREAVLGLWNIYEMILTNAEQCDLDHPADVNQLQLDIKYYARLEQLRPALKDAIKHIRNKHDELFQLVESRKQPDKVRRKRLESVEELGRVITNLDEWIAKLEVEGLMFLPAGSGIGIVDLDRINGLIEQHKLGPDSIEPNALSLLVAEIRQRRPKDELWQTTDRIADAIDGLSRAFKGLL